MLKIVENKKWWFTLSSTIIILGIIFACVRGINTSMDFVGGTKIQIDMAGSQFTTEEVTPIINKYAAENSYSVQQSQQGSNSKSVEMDITAKVNAIKAEDVTNIVNDLKTKYKTDIKVISLDSIGPSIGNELRSKALWSLGIAITLMLVYIGFRFEFKYGAAAVLALVHDVLITLSVYFIFHLPIGSSFITALLTIIGYSMNDTIVIFDRIRENQKGMRKSDLTQVADTSLSQTIRRSIYTVSTTLITTTAVYVCVPAVRDFALPLIVGIASGCYSSIFIASPFYVILKNESKKKAVA